ncbi:hypothetical protein I204_03502 [Kwoniella mangroviensis CBS 8886]|nr:uncharacterized protein I203_00561 [Kwoniella mangroviensis CBS 8507]OCF70427.1 hypothetical protein I203_00561 [Kwoniella mangroviensis CBS 8507]OCF76203.1 hypothetical protein I204_03502 [Kwoniella mangroviensis CBS 8886]
MPQRANNHPSLQRTYQEDMRALAGLVKQLEKVKFRPRKKGKRKKCQRGIRIANTRIVITLSYAATSQVYHDRLRIDEAQEQAEPFLRVLRFLIHEISETLGIIIIDKCLNTVPALS